MYFHFALDIKLDSDHAKLKIGFVIQREDRGEENQWEVTGVFDSFTYWNHDTEPSAKDKPQQWIEEWPQIAAAVNIINAISANTRSHVSFHIFTKIHNPISLEKRRGVKLPTEGITADETIPHQQQETKADAAHKQEEEVEEEERNTTRKRKRQDIHESSEEADGDVAEAAEEETKDSDDEEAENVAKKEKPKRRKVEEEEVEK